MSRAEQAVAAVGLLREREWVRVAVAVVVLSVVFVLLGRWQWHRHEATLTLSHRVNANYSAAPVPVTALLPSPGSPLAPAAEWRQVRVHGSYQPSDTVLIRNRSLNGNFGYEVLVPLRTGSGAMLLVDRGWLPEGATAARPDRVPDPPAGAVDVVVRLRPSEPGTDRRAPPGQAQRIDVAQLGAGLGAPVYRAYGVLAQERPAPVGAPTPLPRPTVDLGPHLAYAVQWWVFALAAYGLLAMNALREVRRRADDPGRPRAQARPRPRRDEDVEDEALDALDALASPPPPR